MAIGKKVVDISDFGYNEPVIFKELSLGDAADISIVMTTEAKKHDGNTPEAIMNMIVLEKLIEKAPFPHDLNGLRNIPLTLGIKLIEEAESMLNPLVKKNSNYSNMTINEEKPQIQL